MNGLKPLLPQTQVKFLILGTFPSLKTRNFHKDFGLDAYYLNPTNQFWEMIGFCFPKVAQEAEQLRALIKAPFPKENAKMIMQLQQKIADITGVVVWDCCKDWENLEGSLDKNLTVLNQNDLLELPFREGLDTIKVIKNGKAKTGKKNQILHNKEPYKDIIYLPSTSAACAMKKQDKFEIWKKILH